MRRPEAVRREFTIFSRLLPRARAVAIRIDRLPGGPDLHWFLPPGAPGDRAILYLHGGGYVAGSPVTHRGLIGRLAEGAGVAACAPDYRLAPEHAFPDQQADALRAWNALRGRGFAPDRIALAGDSAGGGLALSLLADLCAAGTPPAAAAVFSPWTDLAARGESYRANAALDPMLPAERIGDLVDFVMAGHPPDDPRASPLYAAFPACPPVLIHAAKTEILRDDATGMAGRLASHGTRVEIRLWPDTPHAWHVFAGLIPEADAAVAEAASFLRGCLTPPT